MATTGERTFPGGETDSPSAAAAASSAGMPAKSPGSPVPGDASQRGPSAGPEKWPEHVDLGRRPEAPEKLFDSPYPTGKIPEGATSKADYTERSSVETMEDI